ncbi:MAG: DUF4386 domain-containing protein [Bacteroidota bacterium]
MNRTPKNIRGADGRTAILVGALLIIGTVSGALSVALAGSILSDPNYLSRFSENQNQIIMGALFVLMMGLALAMVPVMLFPIFRKYNEALAMGAVVFRGALEAALYIAIVISWLFLLTISQQYVKAGSVDASQFLALGALLLKSSNQIGAILDIVFSLGALMIYYLFYKSKLIPGWLSVWGLVGAMLYLVSGLFALFSVDFGILEAPLALQEMVLAIWLIVKGFNSSPVINNAESIQMAISPA